MIFNEGSKVVVDEAYVGRTPEIQKFYNDFCEIRHRYIGSNRIPTNDECEVVEKYICDIFGFKAAQWGVEIDDQINAWTYPVCTDIFMDTSQMFVTTKNGGYKYTKKAKAVVIIMITRGAFNNEEITDGECFALLLHEIGHSFVTRGSGIQEYIMLNNFMVVYQVVLHMICFNIAAVINDAKRIAFSANVVKNAKLNLNKVVRDSFLRILINANKEVTNFMIKVLSSVLYVLTFPGKLILSIPYKIIAKCINFIYKLLGGSSDRSIEYLADDFAVVYGFGPEKESVLKKFSIGTYDRANPLKHIMVNRRGVVGDVARFVDKSVREVLYSIDAHPTPDKRINQVRKSLIEELDKNKDLNPKVKEELKDNIVQIAIQAEDIDKSNEYILSHKNEAIIAVKELIRSSGGEYDPDWGEKYNLDKDYINRDFKDRLID